MTATTLFAQELSAEEAAGAFKTLLARELSTDDAAGALC
jgi:hypothetical protein